MKRRDMLKVMLAGPAVLMTPAVGVGAPSSEVSTTIESDGLPCAVTPDRKFFQWIDDDWLPIPFEEIKAGMIVSFIVGNMVTLFVVERGPHSLDHGSSGLEAISVSSLVRVANDERAGPSLYMESIAAEVTMESIAAEVEHEVSGL